MATTETLNIVITTKAKGDGAAKAEKGLQGLVKAAKAFAGIAAVGAVAKQAVELGKLGVASQSAQLRFERFAGSAEQADRFLAAFNEGTQGAVDRMTAMSSASRLLQMGLVDTTDEMSQIAAMAIKLGDQTLSTQGRMESFAAMLANQSIPRLDNFGISSGRVRARILELQEATKGLSREEAFKIAVMEEGRKSLERLGDVTDTAAHSTDVANAAWQDMKASVGEVLSTLGEASGIFENTAKRLRGIADMYRAVQESGTSARAVFSAWISIFDKNQTMAEAYVATLRELNPTVISAAQGQRLLSGEYERVLPAKREAVTLTQAEAELAATSATAHQQYQAALAATAANQTAQAAAALELDAANRAAAQAAGEATMAQQSLAASLKDATDAQIAQAAISQLGVALAEGDITLNDYNTAVGQVQLTFGLATEESMKLSDGILGLTSDLADGTLSAEGYDEALLGLIGTTTDAATKTDQLAGELAALPEKTTVIVEYKRIVTGASPPSGAPSGGDAPADSGGDGGSSDTGSTGLVQGAGLLSRTRPVAAPSATLTAGGGAAVGGGLTINATIVSDDPAVIWKKLEQYARLKGKSGWQQLGR